jgi:hypothetical protein
MTSSPRRCQHTTMRGLQCKRKAVIAGFCTNHFNPVGAEEGIGA